ncbi:MAG: Hpt domain-containing protein, partial [Spirochaetes bacterium]|nr:Hpt domain-containing protein [Spirochaetota bacterium]
QERNSTETGLPIIALTAHALHNDHERFKANGLTDVLTKPIEIDKLKQCLQRYLPGVQLHNLPPVPSTDTAKELNMSDKNETEAFNIEKLAQLLNLPFEFLKELIKTFFDEIWLVYRDDLEAAIKSGNFTEIRNKAHKIKGAVANLRFTKASEILGEMEKLATQETSADYQAMFEQVKAMIAKIEQEIAGKAGT